LIAAENAIFSIGAAPFGVVDIIIIPELNDAISVRQVRATPSPLSVDVHFNGR
jgi:hypothetical protein